MSQWPTGRVLNGLLLGDFVLVLVALYKRAQILVADVWACCAGTGYGAFHDIDAITAFADYRIPQLLVTFDVLQYSDSLMQTLVNSKYMD